MDRGSDEKAKQNGEHGCDDGGGDVSEWNKVAELRAVVEAKDPASKEEDDFMLRRFLRARDQNIGKASAMFLKYLSWKRAAKPRGPITDDEVRNELAQEKLYVQGHDKTGRPMVYLFGARHIAAKRDLDEFKRFVVYILDNVLMCSLQAAGGAGEVCGGGGPEGVRVRELRHPGDAGGAGHHAEQLPGAAGAGVPHPRPLRLHGGLENGVPLHRRQHQEEVRVRRRQGAGCHAAGRHRRVPAARGVRREAQAPGLQRAVQLIS